MKSEYATNDYVIKAESGLTDSDVLVQLYTWGARISEGGQRVYVTINELREIVAEYDKAIRGTKS